MKQKDIFNFPMPLVGSGSVKGELEKRETFIEKQSHPKPNSSRSIATEKKNNKDSAEDKMRELARKSSQVLFQLRTVFPFDFFPDTITINANKIDVVQSEFFFSHNTTSIPIKDIANVEVETIPFFATIKLINIRAPMRPISISFLKHDEAIRAKKIIDGLLVATEQGADVSSIEPKQFLRHIEVVGRSFG
jgi:hypothetical protein